MKGALQAAAVAVLLIMPFFVAPALAHGGGGGGGGGGHGGGGHGGGGHGGSYTYIPIYVGGGTPVVPDTEVGDYAAIHKVALLSAIGTKLDIPSAFQHADQPDATALDIDGLVATTLQKYLGAKYVFVDMPFDRNALVAIHRQMFRESSTLSWLKTLTNPGVDAYILVRPADGALPGPDAVGIVVGSGAVPEGFLVTNFEIDIIDAHRLTYIAKAFARIQTQEGQPPEFATKPMGLGQISALMLGLNPQPALDLLHRHLADLLPHALVDTLRSLKMDVALPPVGDHSISEPATASVMKNIHAVAVASALGDTFQLVNPGNMFVKVTDAQMPFGDAGIDDKAEAIARAVLARHYTVKDVPVDRADLAGQTLFIGHPIPAMAGIKPTTDVDAYVLIVKATAYNRLYHGLGLMHVTPLMNHQTAVFADYAIVVVDAHTLRSLAAIEVPEGPTRPCAEPEMFSAGIPECSVNESLWPTDGAKLPPAGVTQAADQVMKILSNGIPEALFRLGLDEPGTTTAGSAGRLGSE